MFVTVDAVRPAYDVVIVGSGFGSMFYLHKLRELNPQASVLILEWGQNNSWEWQMDNMSNSPLDTRELHAETWGEKMWNYTVGLGGGTNCWWALTPRLRPSDMKLKSLYGVGEDWPMEYEALSPYYDQAEDIMMVSGDADIGIISPRSKPYPQPPHRLSTPDEILKRAMPDQHFAFPSARLRMPVGDRGACCSTDRCGLCPTQAKWSALNGISHLFDDPNTHVLTGAKVDVLDLHGDRVDGVVFDHGDRQYSVKGERVILGANGIQSPYILLKSGDEHPAVGRYLHEKMITVVEAKLDGVKAFDGGTGSTGINYAMHEGPHRSEYGACILFTENSWITGLRPEWGRWREVWPIVVNIEDIPQADNRVLVGADGRPKVEHADYSPYAYKGFDAAMEKLPKVLESLPVEDIRVDNRLLTGSHVQGTLRMGHDPERFVVDANLVHHKYRNLTCVGTSVWPNCSTVNPSLTAAALSLMAAEHAEA